VYYMRHPHFVSGKSSVRCTGMFHKQQQQQGWWQLICIFSRLWIVGFMCSKYVTQQQLVVCGAGQSNAVCCLLGVCERD